MVPMVLLTLKNTGILGKHKLILKLQEVFGVTGGTFHQNTEAFINELYTFIVEKYIDFSLDDWVVDSSFRSGKIRLEININ